MGRTVYQNVPPKCEEECPDCHRKLYKHGHYFRHVITSKEILKIPIYRRLCLSCGKTFSLIPDFLIPYHVHNGWILQKAWIMRYEKGKSYNFIREVISSNETGGYLTKQ